MKHLAAGASAVVLFSACVTNGAPPLPPSAGTVFRRASFHERVPSSEAKAAPKLYVSDPVGNAVNVYPIAGHNQRPIAKLTKGIGGPAGLAADSTGNVYVANTLKNTVTEYRPNQSAPARTYSKDLLGPVDVGVDSKGTLYVVNFYSFRDSIVEFPAGSAKPSLTIRNPGSSYGGLYPLGLTLDAKDTLYVAYQDFYSQTWIYTYGLGQTKAVERNLNFGLIRWLAAGLLFDKAANLLVANGSLPGIQVFPPRKADPSKVFGKQGSPESLQFDSDERDVFVADTARNAVEEYSYPAGALVNTITSGLKSVYGVTVSPPWIP